MKTVIYGALALIYAIGYFVFVIGAGVSAWSQMPFSQWITYMIWQATIWGLLWPLTLIF